MLPHPLSLLSGLSRGEQPGSLFDGLDTVITIFERMTHDESVYVTREHTVYISLSNIDVTDCERMLHSDTCIL